MELIAVVLKSPTSTQRFESAKTLLNYGFAAYALAQARPPEPLSPIPVELGDAPCVTPRLEDSPVILAAKEKVNAMEVAVELEERLSAPVEAGQQVGRMVVTSGEEVLAELPLVAEKAVARLTYWQILEQCLRTAFMGA